MKISYVVVVGLVPLAEYFVGDNFLPCVAVNCLVKDQLYRVNYVAVEAFKII